VLIILEPSDEGNYTGHYLTTQRVEYQRWLHGLLGKFRFQEWDTYPEAYDACERANG
jgi:hypothetical protein